MATLYMNDGVTALRLIFHLPRINPATGALIFTNRALVLFVLPYFALMISTFGTVELHTDAFTPFSVVQWTALRLLGQCPLSQALCPYDVRMPAWFPQVLP